MNYEYARLGVTIKIDVFAKTGPFTPVTGPFHGCKTFRNQNQYGIRMGSTGTGRPENRSVVALQETPGSGLQHGDVENTDKQDDGAARRFFHVVALNATTAPGESSSEPNARPEFPGLFVCCYGMPLVRGLCLSTCRRR